jgi:hypothetical protein
VVLAVVVDVVDVVDVVNVGTVVVVVGDVVATREKVSWYPCIIDLSCAQTLSGTCTRTAQPTPAFTKKVSTL